MKATFAAGCFWNVEEAFRNLEGVTSTKVGYTGGTTKNPTYKDVCNKETGHAEAVQLEYNQKKISYHKLLKTFWKIYDPPQLNRQGPDIGSQYRSAIFYHNKEQKQLAEKSKPKNALTEIVKASTFYKAEEYHQHYLEKKQQII